ncbi:MAG TPA: hypothetical protein VH877_20795 [Polyangia bacterium]|nr:hypothetical protein [Polyangia bacterium]
MAKLTLSDLRLILADMLDQRRPLLERMATGRVYLPLLEKRLEAIQALPGALTARPLADELEAIDQSHDGFGAAIFFICRAYEEVPGLDPTVRAAAQRIRATLIPSLGELTRTYMDEAEAALRREPELIRMRADMDLIPVHGGTLLGWAKSFIEQGKRLDSFLNQRGAVQAETSVSSGERRRSAGLRANTLALLRRMREGLDDELSSNEALERGLVQQIFGYYDKVVLMSAASERLKEGSPEPEGTPTAQDADDEADTKTMD